MTLIQLQTQSKDYNNPQNTVKNFFNSIKKNKIDFDIIWEDQNGYDAIPAIVIEDPLVTLYDTYIKIDLVLLGSNIFCKDSSQNISFELHLIECMSIKEGNLCKFNFKSKDKTGNIIVTIKIRKS